MFCRKTPQKTIYASMPPSEFYYRSSCAFKKGLNLMQSLLVQIFTKYSGMDAYHKAINTTYLALNILGSLGRKLRSPSFKLVTFLSLY